MQAQSSEAEAASAAAQVLLESTQAEAAATLITTRAGLQAALETAESDLAYVKVAVPTDYSDMHSKFSRNPMAELLSLDLAKSTQCIHSIPPSSLTLAACPIDYSACVLGV